MGITEKIIKALEESMAEAEKEQKQPVSKPPSRRSLQVKSTYSKPAAVKKKGREFNLIGHAVGWPPIDWDGLGLGLVRPMGFVHNRPVKLTFKDETWTISGPHANSTVMWFIFAGGGTLVYFLRDLISQVEEWGSVFGALVPVLFSLLGLLFRKKTYVFKSYEVEMLAYDSENHILIFSTITQPGGVVAIKPDLPPDEIRLKAMEQNLMTDLRKVHNGFFKVDGLARSDMSPVKSWSLWTFLWLIILYFGYKYFF